MTWETGEAPSSALTAAQRRVLVALCRPMLGSEHGYPATNKAIAAELTLSVDAVKTHLRVLFGKFELNELAQNQKRATLAQCVFQLGLISQRDLG